MKITKQATSYSVNPKLHELLCRIATDANMSTSQLLEILVVGGLNDYGYKQDCETCQIDMGIVAVYAGRIKRKDRA